MESSARTASIRPITIRLTGPHGTSRIKVANTGTVNELYTAAESSLGSEAGSLTLSTDLPGQKLLNRGSQSIKQAGLMNGDQLYIQTGVKEYMAVPSAMETDSPAASATTSKRPATANNKTFRIDDIPDEVEEGPVTAKYTPTLAVHQPTNTVPKSVPCTSATRLTVVAVGWCSDSRGCAYAP